MLFVMNSSLSSLVLCWNYAIFFTTSSSTHRMPHTESVSLWRGMSVLLSCVVFWCCLATGCWMWLWCQPKGLHFFFCLCQVSWALPQQTAEWGSCLHPFMVRCDLRAGCTSWCLLSHQPFQPSSTYNQCHSSEWAFCTSGYSPFQKMQLFPAWEQGKGWAAPLVSLMPLFSKGWHTVGLPPWAAQAHHQLLSLRDQSQFRWLSQIRDARKASSVRKTSGNSL